MGDTGAQTIFGGTGAPTVTSYGGIVNEMFDGSGEPEPTPIPRKGAVPLIGELFRIQKKKLWKFLWSAQ